MDVELIKLSGVTSESTPRWKDVGSVREEQHRRNSQKDGQFVEKRKGLPKGRQHY